jgi:hypothetical protein
VTPELDRLERKVDTLLEAVTKLVLFEERQSVQSLAITSLANRTDDVEKKLDMWINRGVGAWAIAATALTLYQTFKGTL